MNTIHPRAERLTRIAVAAVLGLVASLSLSAHANLIEYSFTTPQGTHRTVPADTQYTNAVGTMSFALSGGVDRRVEIALLSESGSMISNASSDLLGADDRILAGNSEYYGALLLLAAPGQGSYQLRSRIIASDGGVVSEQVDPFMVDTTPPQATNAIHITSDSRVVHQDAQGNRIAGPGAGPGSWTNFGGFYIQGLQPTGSPIERVDFTATDQHGVTRTASRINVDSGSASVSLAQVESVMVHPEGMYDAAFRIYDKAGNVRVIAERLGWDQSPYANGSPAPVAVYSPSSSGSWNNMAGYVPFVDGMVVRENPVQLVFRVPKANYAPHTPFGLRPRSLNRGVLSDDVGGDRKLFEDTHHAYYLSGKHELVKHGNNELVWWFGDNFANNGSVSTNIGLHAASPAAPVIVDAVHVTETGHRVTPDIFDRLNLNNSTGKRITHVEFEVEPRSYTQRLAVRYSNQDVTIPAGQTKVTVPINLTWWNSQSHGRLPGNVTNSYHSTNSSLVSRQHSANIFYDFNDPVIVGYTIDPVRRQLVLHAREESSDNGSFYNWFYLQDASLAFHRQGGESVTLAPVRTDRPSANDFYFTFDLSELPESQYTSITATVIDRNWNETQQDYAGSFYRDTTPPVLSFNLDDDTTIESLDHIEIHLVDDRDPSPRIRFVELTGGPTDERVTLSARPLDNGRFQLEYPIMFPSLSVGDYVLEVQGIDWQDNTATERLSFTFEPRLVALSGDDDGRLLIPAATHEFRHADGRRIIETEPLTLADGAAVAGTYDVFASLRADAEVPLYVNGVLLQPGVTTQIMSRHNFGASDGRLSLPLMAAEQGVVGESTLLISTSAPNAPVVLVAVQTWLPGLSLKSDSWSLYPALDEVMVTVANGTGHCAALTSDEHVARTSGNPLSNPVCLVEWQRFPRELYGASLEGEPLLTGYVPTVGEAELRAGVFLVTEAGERIFLETLEATLDVLLPDGSIKTRLNPEVTTVERLLETIQFTIEQTEGPRCAIITTDKDVALDEAGRGRPACLLTWEDIPSGLEPDLFRRTTPSLLGEIEETEGDTATIAWTIDAFTPAGTKVPMGRYTKTLDVVDPPLPTFEISSRRDLGDGLYTLSQEGGYLGDYTVEGRPVSIWAREIVNGELVAEEEALGFFSRVNRITRRLILDEAPLWSYTDVTLEAFYSRLPSMVSSHSLRVLAVPKESLRPVISLDETTVLNTEEMVVDVQLQDPFSPDQPYSAETMGEWEVRILNFMSLTRKEPLTDYLPLGPDGTASFQVDPKQVDANGFRMVAQARLISPEPRYEREVLSPRPLYVTVLRGEAIGAEVTGRRFSGPAPLTFIGMLQLDNRLDQGAMGQVIWELRETGQADWQPVEDTGFVKGRIMKTFQAGKYELRARIPNVNSGAEYITEAVEIHAFDVPTVSLEGPWNVFIGDTGTYRIKAALNGEEVPADQLEVLWSLDDGATWQPGEASMAISRDTLQRVTLRARTRLLNSDAEVDDAWVERRGRISFRPVLPPRAGIVGPRVIEMGTEHEWRSVLRPPFRHMEVHQNGYFVLPDGTRVDGEVLRYTPTEADLQNGFVTIGFVSWIDGFPETHNEISQRIRVWIYEWPRWDFYSRLTSMEAPATLSIRVRSPGSRARYIEGLSYEWHLPEGAVVEQARSGDSRVLSFAQAGSYPITVDIRDDRGHHSRITETIVLDEQTPWEADYRLNYSNAAMREPLTVGFRPMVSGGHPRDRVTTFRYLLNGEVVASDIRYGSVQVPVGEHEIAMQFDTEFGHTVEKREMLSVAPNQPPVCGLDVRTLDSSWRFYAECRDPDGTVVGHRWLINGEPVGVSGSRISITRRDEQKPSVTLYGIDDAGSLSAPVNW